MTSIIEYTASTKTIKLDDTLLSSLWASNCEKHTCKLSIDAIVAFMRLSYDFATVNTFGTDVAGELSSPFVFANSGAVIYPDDFQCWESYDLSLAEWDNQELILTWEGSVMLDKMNRACEKERALFLKDNGMQNHISIEF